MEHTWLSTLKTATPKEDYDPAVKFARTTVKFSPPSDEIWKRLRSDYDQNADSLIAASHVVAVNVQTVAAANGYWRTA